MKAAGWLALVHQEMGEAGVDPVSRSLVQAWSKEWQARVAFLDKGKISTLQIKRTTRPSGSFLSHKFHG